MSIGISYMGANEVARQVGFRMGEWGEGDRAANAWYAPIETFPARFGELTERVSGMGFSAMDVWTAHLNPAWATEAHIAAARELLDRHGLRVVSLAGGFGSTVPEFEATCRLAVALGRPILGGSAAVWRVNRRAVLEALERHDLRLAFENHPEKTPREMLDHIGDAPARVGTAADTGWYGTQGYDAARAIEELGSRVLHVHLKDVREVGQHRTCAFGDGIVPIEGCVRALQGMGYDGDVSIEHEPHDYDPTNEVAEGAWLLRSWLAQVPA